PAEPPLPPLPPVPAPPVPPEPPDPTVVLPVVVPAALVPAVPAPPLPLVPVVVPLLVDPGGGATLSSALHAAHTVTTRLLSTKPVSGRLTVTLNISASQRKIGVGPAHCM